MKRPLPRHPEFWRIFKMFQLDRLPLDGNDIHLIARRLNRELYIRLDWPWPR